MASTNMIPSARAGALPASASAARINDLSLPHIESFNYMLDTGLAVAVADIPVREFSLASGAGKMTLWIESASVGYPTKQGSGVADPRLLPAECRERGMTYAAPLNVTICRRVNDGEVTRLSTKLGDVPIMVRSTHCHLHGLSPSNLVKAGEEAYEFGGYFICNGIERIIRMLQIPKRNYPMAITRSAYMNRGPLYSNKGVVIRCARPDQSSVTLTLHYLNDGSATVRFTVRKQEFFLPVIMVLKALVPTTDREIYERVLAGDRNNTYLSDRVLMLLRDAKRYESALHSRDSALAFLGARFRTVLDVPETFTDVQVGQTLLDRYVLVHLPGDARRDKFNLLILMLRKLYAFVAGSILEDNADSLANQELLLSGHLLLLFLKEKLYEFTQGVELSIKKEDLLYARSVTAKAKIAAAIAAAAEAEAAASSSSKKKSSGSSKKKGSNKDDGHMSDADDTTTTAAAATTSLVLPKVYANATPINLDDATWFRKIVDRQPEVGKKAYYLLATGNLTSSSGLDLMQVSGYTVVADKINFLRFTTHFRSVHRGQFFAEMKTTTVRKLLPENWGFLCPVHTPDGGPCGLLNHLSQPATVVAHPLSTESFVRAATRAGEIDAAEAAAAEKSGDGMGGSTTTNGVSIPSNFSSSMSALLVSLGMVPHAATGSVLPADHLPVVLDGRVLGGAPPHTVYSISRTLRYAKALASGCPGGIEGLHIQGREAAAKQQDAVAALRRAACLGLTDVRDLPRVARRMAHIGGGGAEESNSSNNDDESNSSIGGVGSMEACGLPGLGAIGIVPPSMEVAFIPPSWWDAEVDPRIEDPSVAEERAARCGFAGAKPSQDAKLLGVSSSNNARKGGQHKNIEGEEKKNEGSGSGRNAASSDEGEEEEEEKAFKMKLDNTSASLSNSSSSNSKNKSSVTPSVKTATALLVEGTTIATLTGVPTDDDKSAPTKLVGLFPGLFLHTAPQRLIRPVLQLDTGLIELISPLEQPYMDIACTPEDIEDILHVNLEAQNDKNATSSDRTTTTTTSSSKKKSSSSSSSSAAHAPPILYTHIELSAVAMLSELACLTPFSDMNQSPRNMYQCQMAKQTMGTPLHSWNRRTDTKLFRLQTPQAPLVQNSPQSLYGFDEYPNGANACVAVIAYTGFDMEDACIINKSAFERGFGWGSVYKTFEVDLLKDKPNTDAGRYIFHNQYVKGEAPVRGGIAAANNYNNNNNSAVPRVRPGDKIYDGLDEDGLPPVGLLLKEGDALYCYLDAVTSTHRVIKHKDVEPAYVDEIRIIAPGNTSAPAAHIGVQRISIKLRYDRRPVVGDKFSSRHGQKGVLSYLWPQENMPFNDAGMTPDVIINPHAFPSRMTVGMLVEMMAGKAGALHGTFQDSTPFRFGEERRAVDHFGEQLVAAGYNYHGTETFYSGVTGEPLGCDIYYGVVYYQRLRHMVKDKAQARSTGPINSLTRQPVKGRKKGGGIRFGEMERDSLLAHGAAFLLHDRLMNCSDRHIALVCRKCGSLLATHSVPASVTLLTSASSATDNKNTAEGEQQSSSSFGVSGFTSSHINLGGGGEGGAAAAGGLAAGGGGNMMLNRRRRQPVCRACGTGDYISPVPVPYVFRYLANELAGMNIKIQLELGEGPYGPATLPPSEPYAKLETVSGVGVR